MAFERHLFVKMGLVFRGGDLRHSNTDTDGRSESPGLDWHSLLLLALAPSLHFAATSTVQQRCFFHMILSVSGWHSSDESVCGTITALVIVRWLSVMGVPPQCALILAAVLAGEAEGAFGASESSDSDCSDKPFDTSQYVGTFPTESTAHAAHVCPCACSHDSYTSHSDDDNMSTDSDSDQRTFNPAEHVGVFPQMPPNPTDSHACAGHNGDDGDNGDASDNDPDHVCTCACSHSTHASPCDMSEDGTSADSDSSQPFNPSHHGGLFPTAQTTPIPTGSHTCPSHKSDDCGAAPDSYPSFDSDSIHSQSHSVDGSTARFGSPPRSKKMRKTRKSGRSRGGANNVPAAERITTLNAPGAVEGLLKQTCSGVHKCGRNSECLHTLAAAWRAKGKEKELCDLIRQERLKLIVKIGGGIVNQNGRKQMVNTELTHEIDQTHSAFGSTVCRSTWLILMGHPATAFKRAKSRAGSQMLDGRTSASGRKVYYSIFSPSFSLVRHHSCVSAISLSHLLFWGVGFIHFNDTHLLRNSYMY